MSYFLVLVCWIFDCFSEHEFFICMDWMTKRDKYVPNSAEDLLNTLELALPYLYTTSVQANQHLAT